MLTTIQMRRVLYALFSALVLIGVLATSQRTIAEASNAVNVTVKVQSPLGTIPDTAFGVNTAVWDGLLLESEQHL